MKKLLWIALLLAMLLVLASCSDSPPEGSINAPEQSTPSADGTPFVSEGGNGGGGDSALTTDVMQSEMWMVELIRAEIADSLTATMAAVQYGGGILESTSEVVPSGGNTFLLLNLTVKKTGTGRASFSWSDAHIEDADGNVYYRHPNDTFLANLNIPRLKGTDIVLGVESGYVCFEISKDATDLRFVADEGRISIRVVAE